MIVKKLKSSDSNVLPSVCVPSDTRKNGLKKQKIKTATNLLQVIGCPNLYLRNQTFYIRKVIEGKPCWISLHTGDVTLAKCLYSQFVLNFKSQNVKNFSFFEKFFSQTTSSIYMRGAEKTVPPNATKGDFTMANQKKEHSFLSIWAEMPHHCNSRTKQQSYSRLKTLVSCMGKCTTVEKFVENPKVLNQMIDKLRKVKIGRGSRKGETMSQKTAKEYLKVLKQVLTYSYDRNYISCAEMAGVDMAFKRVNRRGNGMLAGFKNSDKRIPYNEADMHALMTRLYDIHNRHDLSIVHDAIRVHPEWTKELQPLLKNPDDFYYIVLLLLFTGSRENAIATLRIQDIDLDAKVAYIHVDKELLKAGDIREEKKALKTPEAQRKVPLADILFDLGLREFVLNKKKRYGSSAFLFEAVTKNQTNEGYRINNVGEALNRFFQIIGIKSAEQGFVKDVHSLKKTFYSANRANNGVSLEMLEAIAGQAPSMKGEAAQTYTVVSYSSCPREMSEAVNKLSYAHLGVLFGGYLPAQYTQLETEKEKRSTSSTYDLLVGNIEQPNNLGVNYEWLEQAALKTGQSVFDTLGIATQMSVGRYVDINVALAYLANGAKSKTRYAGFGW